METLTSLAEWSHLSPLLEFRNRVIEICRDPQSREMRPDGVPGRLKLSLRKQLLSELLRLEDRLGMRLLTAEEIATIKVLWQDPRYNSYLASDSGTTIDEQNIL